MKARTSSSSYSMSAGLSRATMRQKTQPPLTARAASCILGSVAACGPDDSFWDQIYTDYVAKETGMGTCPKCKLRIRKNGNHTKLGSIWYHKMCPAKPARAAK